MPIEVDIRKTFLYKWGKEEGEKEGLKEAIRAKTCEDFIKVLKNPNSKSKNSKGK